jgi:hypothetical protein
MLTGSARQVALPRTLENLARAAANWALAALSRQCNRLVSDSAIWPGAHGSGSNQALYRGYRPACDWSPPISGQRNSVPHRSWQEVLGALRQQVARAPGAP